MQHPSSSTPVDLITLRTLSGLKHRIQQVTRLLDATGTTMFPPQTIEAKQFMHAVAILLDELRFHGLFLPVDANHVAVLSPNDVLRSFTSTSWHKSAPTKIRPFTQSDVERLGPSFLDLEGQTQRVEVGRCLCVGVEGEQWTCSASSLERDRFPISEPDAEGFRLYRDRLPRRVLCFDLPFPFLLVVDARQQQWQSQVNGAVITWNGLRGEALDMRVVKHSVFLATYARDEAEGSEQREPGSNEEARS